MTVDLELEIGRNEGAGYPVLARSGKETATTRLPVSSVELERQLVMLRSAVLTSSTQAGPEADKDQQHMRELGTELFGELFAGDVRELYAAGRQRACEQDSTMRLVLRVYPPELARLPWEYLFDPTRRGYLGLSVSLVRYPEMVLAPRQPLRTAVPLRILGMLIGSDPDGGQAEQERQRLQEALAGLERDGLVELGWVGGSTAGDLAAALDRGPWHGFHAISADGQDGGDGVSRLLAEHHTMRLVVLNAHGADAEGFADIAGALMRRGISAVVAMQFALTESAATAFAQPFYHSVATGLPVDIGVMRARRAVPPNGAPRCCTCVPRTGRSSRPLPRPTGPKARRAHRCRTPVMPRPWTRSGRSSGIRPSRCFGSASIMTPITRTLPRGWHRRATSRSLPGVMPRRARRPTRVTGSRPVQGSRWWPRLTRPTWTFVTGWSRPAGNRTP
jgi:hypothetical protein